MTAAIEYAERNQSVTGAWRPIHSAVVDWLSIRAAFIGARGRSKKTQAKLAADAGLQQGDISKLESNDNLGPTVGTFVKAVEGGLGLSMSEFFLHLEKGTIPAQPSSISGGSARHGGDVSPTSTSNTAEDEARALRRLGDAFYAAAASAVGTSTTTGSTRKPRARATGRDRRSS